MTVFLSNGRTISKKELEATFALQALSSSPSTEYHKKLVIKEAIEKKIRSYIFKWLNLKGKKFPLSAKDLNAVRARVLIKIPEAKKLTPYSFRDIVLTAVKGFKLDSSQVKET